MRSGFFLNLNLSLILLIMLTGCASTKGPKATSPETMYKEGEALYTKGKYEDAISLLRKVKESGSSPELTILAGIRVADAQFSAGKYIEAAASYEDFRKLHPTNEKSAYALYRIGLCHYNQITGIDTDQTPVKNAVIKFESFLNLYPTSEYVADARQKLESSRLKQLQHEIYVGDFYLRTGKYPSAIKRLEEALVLFPKSSGNDQTLFLLGKAYFKNDQKDKGVPVFNRLITEFPNSKYVKEAKNFIK